MKKGVFVTLQFAKKKTSQVQLAPFLLFSVLIKEKNKQESEVKYDCHAK